MKNFSLYSIVLDEITITAYTVFPSATLRYGVVIRVLRKAPNTEQFPTRLLGSIRMTAYSYGEQYRQTSPNVILDQFHDRPQLSSALNYPKWLMVGQLGPRDERWSHPYHRVRLCTSK